MNLIFQLIERILALLASLIAIIFQQKTIKVIAIVLLCFYLVITRRNLTDSIKYQKETTKIQTESKILLQELNIKIDSLIGVIFKDRVTRVMNAPREITPALQPKPTGQIKVIKLEDGAYLPAQTYIEGIVSDPHVKVWAIVHPVGLSAYWVQPAVTVNSDGSWKVMIYLGRTGNIDVDKHFEIMVIANPITRLNEADILSKWPEAEWRSEIIEVIRK
jgi:hypothetical protein